MSNTNNIPFNWNEEQDNSLFSSFINSGNNPGNVPQFDQLKSPIAFDDLSNKYATSSPFGVNSEFNVTANGSFITLLINKKYLSEKIIHHTSRKSIMKYFSLDYHGGMSFSDFTIDNKAFDVDVEINSLNGYIDFSKQPGFSFDFKLEKQTAEFKLYYEFVKFKNSAKENRFAIILTFKSYIDLKVFLDKLNKELVLSTYERIKREFTKAFILANDNPEVLDFVYQTAPDFVLMERKDEDLYSDLKILSAKAIDTIGTNENVSILNIINSFKNKKWFFNIVNRDPKLVMDLLRDFSSGYVEKLIISLSKIGYSVWTKEEKEKAWRYELLYPEFGSFGIDETRINETYTTLTGFAYYIEASKMFKIGTAFFVYDSRINIAPKDKIERGPEKLQHAYTPMKINVDGNISYIPVFVAEYFTEKKIDEEWWAMLQNITAGLLPESSASVKAVSTISKLFKGKKIQTVEELIEFLNKVDDSVKAQELEEYGIEVLFRGTTRNLEGELFVGNISSIENGTSTSTDPIRAVVFGTESATLSRQKGFLQIFVPKEMEGLYLQASQRGRYSLELEVVVNTSPQKLSNYATIEIPIEDARKIVEEVYGIPLDTRIQRGEANRLLRDTEKLTPKQALQFYKKAIELKK